MINASTTELDDVDTALAEIMNQIDLKTLSKNAAGILSCYYEFIESGIVKKLCEALPFDVIGLTTMSSASDGDYGMYRLTLTILTSDDVAFQSAMTRPLSLDDFEAPLRDAWQEAKEKLPGEPSFVIAAFPVVPNLSSADILKGFDKVCQGIPVWGGVLSDVTMSFENGKTICNGRDDQNALAMLLLHGPVQPGFIVTSLPDRNIQERRAVVTESKGCVVKKANNMVLQEYFQSLGLTLRMGVDATSSVPLMVSYGDGSQPVALGIYSMNADGSALCAGEIPEGAEFSIGSIDSEGILETAKSTVERALEGKKPQGILMFPCVSRYGMLAPRNESELQEVLRVVEELGKNEVPFALAYVGGEICPVAGNDGKLHNRLHNYTFAACVF
jgi:hypothetical protein